MPARKVVPKPVAPPTAKQVPAPRHATPAAARETEEEEIEEEQASAAPGKRQGHAGKNKKPPLGILSGAGLVVAAAVLFQFRAQIFGGSTRAEEEGASAASGMATAPEPTTATGTPQASAGDPAAEATREPTQAEHEPRKSEKAALKAQDPTSLDLAAIPDFQPTQDTSAEEWAQMSAWMTQWMDAEAGPAGNRAKLELIEQERKAVPAVLNYFKKQDFATKEGRGNGDQCQKALMQICNGTNFDWRYADEAAGRPYDFPEDVYFCKRVVAEWVKAWRPVEHSIEAWIQLAKLEEKDPAEAERLRERFGGQTSTDPAATDHDLEAD